MTEVGTGDRWNVMHGNRKMVAVLSTALKKLVVEKKIEMLRTKLVIGVRMFLLGIIFSDDKHSSMTLITSLIPSCSNCRPKKSARICGADTIIEDNPPRTPQANGSCYHSFHLSAGCYHCGDAWPQSNFAVQLRDAVECYGGRAGAFIQEQ